MDFPFSSQKQRRMFGWRPGQLQRISVPEHNFSESFVSAKMSPGLQLFSYLISVGLSRQALL